MVFFMSEDLEFRFVLKSLLLPLLIRRPCAVESPCCGCGTDRRNQQTEPRPPLRTSSSDLLHDLIDLLFELLPVVVVPYYDTSSRAAGERPCRFFAHVSLAQDSVFGI